ncbi:hypothetical protein ARHIZOSPH14_12890 [Agromyces rhizosphaerae]|uniref:DUF4258 domain-containing protein n=1 Tax=Agromyces rhizosphaerae TaxID=88374 RepID=A0A9W6FQW3_9MICO|nr:hypothetical protein ARHIZOSPH14_12890 [Agromyces rhizosphaerae]
MTIRGKVRQHYIDGVEIRSSARKHGIVDSDIRHAIRHPRVYREVERDGELQILVLGPARDGRFLEIVLVPARDPVRVIHADVLRPRWYDLL